MEEKLCQSSAKTDAGGSVDLYQAAVFLDVLLSGFLAVFLDAALAVFVLANSLLLAGGLARQLAVVVAAFRRCRSRTTSLALDPVDSEQIERCTNLSVKSDPCTPPRFSLASGPAANPKAVRKVDPAEFRRKDCGSREPSKIVLRSAIGFVRAAVFGAVVLPATILFLGQLKVGGVNGYLIKNEFFKRGVPVLALRRPRLRCSRANWANS